MSTRRTGILVLLCIAIGIALGAVGMLRFGRKPEAPRQHEKNEYSVIVLGDATGKCMVREPRPPDIYTMSSSSVTWLVAGSCAGAPEVRIDRNVRTPGKTQDIFSTEGDLRTTAEHGKTITARLKGNLTPDNKRVLYEYTILINGKPAEYASLAEPGLLYACPFWPC